MIHFFARRHTKKGSSYYNATEICTHTQLSTPVRTSSIESHISASNGRHRSTAGPRIDTKLFRSYDASLRGTTSRCRHALWVSIVFPSRNRGSTRLVPSMPSSLSGPAWPRRILPAELIFCLTNFAHSFHWSWKSPEKQHSHIINLFVV